MIYTFYSYKGGVGRSMALANVAEYLRRAGLRVVMVDWDLEAPGLEEYFWSKPEELDLVHAQVGVIDLLLEYMRLYPRLGLGRAATEAGAAGEPAGDGEEERAVVMKKLRDTLRPLADSLFPVRGPEEDGSAGGLWLLPSGMRFGEGFSVYARAVQTFDWRQLYAAYRGEEYFEWMREQLVEFADVVLVDSRTGVTEMGGVCARQLADTVVSLCAPNRQNVEGVLRMSDSFARPEVLQMRRGRPLDLLVVPTRIDASENDLMASFREGFYAKTSRFVPEAFEKVGRDFSELRIPYVPLYAFGERLAVGDPKANPDLVGAYRKLALHLALLAPEGSRLRQSLAHELKREFAGLLPRVAVVGASPADPEAARLRAAFHEAGIEVWESFPGLAAGGASLGDGAASPVEHLVVLLPRDPAAWAPARAEWQAARRLGVCAHAVRAPDAPPPETPAWLEGASVHGPEEVETLVSLLRSPCRAVRVPLMAPPPPPGALPRRAALEELAAALRASGGISGETAVVLAGLSGAGKTTLAQMACHDDRVIAAFSGGIYWVDGAGEPAVAQQLQRIYMARTGREVGTAEPEAAAERVRLAVGDAPYLLVVDEPRDAGAARALPPLGGRGCRLVVSRDRTLVSETGTRVVMLGPMTAAESVALLRGDAAPAGEAEPVLAELAERAHHWPLALQPLAAQLRERQALGQTLESAARELALRAGRAEKGAALPPSVLAALGHTLAPLGAGDRARLGRLAELVARKKVEEMALEEAWGGTPADRKDTALRLAALSLVEVDAEAERARPHPVVVYAVRQDPGLFGEPDSPPSPPSVLETPSDRGGDAESYRRGPEAPVSPPLAPLAPRASSRVLAGVGAAVLAAALLAVWLLWPAEPTIPTPRASALATFDDSLIALTSSETPPEERKALFLALRTRSTNLQRANLSGLDLSQQNLADLDLSNADLTGARLVDARFDKATLTGARLDRAILTGAVLEGADLSNATVQGARFDGANLRSAILANVRLETATTTPQTTLQNGTPGPYRPGEDAAPRSADLTEESARQEGVIWIGNYDATRRAWEKQRLAGATLQPVTRPPGQIVTNAPYRVLGDMTLRSAYPEDDDDYFNAVPALGWVPENSTVTVLDTPRAYDRTRYGRDGRIQYWVRVRVDTVPRFMYVHYQDRADSDLAGRVADALRASGYSIRLVANRPNARNTETENVRYFRAADQPRAREVAAIVQQVLEDNGVDGFTPRIDDRSRTAAVAALGQIEVWLPPLPRAAAAEARR